MPGPRGTTTTADVVVIGLGGAGAYAALEAARAGARVVGLERHALLHDRGAYAGESRLFRAAYHEGAEYLPWLLEARRRWLDLQATGRRSLLVECGALSIATPGAPSLRGVIASLENGDVPHEVLETDQLRRRYPQHGNLIDEIGVLDLLGGVLRPEASVAEIQRQAVEAGADLRGDHEVLALEEDERGIDVVTAHDTLRTSRVIITAGVRSTVLLPQLRAPLRLVPLALTWFAPPNPARYEPHVFPVFLRDRGETHVFGVPTLDGSLMKAGFAAVYEPIPEPEALPASLTQAQLAQIGAAVTAFLPELPRGIARHSLHLDAYTPDRRPLLGPVSARMVVATGFSGHGFKLAPAFGAAAAALALDEPPGHDVTPFSLGRFA